MKTLEQKKQEVLEITDPREAYIKIYLDRDLQLTEMEEISQAYMEKHGVTTYDMAYHPNGERVLTVEMFLESQTAHKSTRWQTMEIFNKDQWTDIIDGIKRSTKEIPLKPRKSKCNDCAKRIRSTERVMCEVYPNGIPKQIRINEQECPGFEEK